MAEGPGGGLRARGGGARGRPVALAACAAVVLAGCGSATPARSSRSLQRAASTTTPPLHSASSTASSAPATTTGGGGPASAGRGSTAGGGSAATAAAGPTPAQPGTYQYSQSGSFKAGLSSQSVPAQGTVVIDPPSAESPGSWSQVWHSYVDPSQPPSDTTFAIAPSGVAIVAEVIRMSGLTFSCTFSPPVEVLSWPPAVGHRFSGTGQCGSFTAQVSGEVTGTEPTTVDGTGVTAYVVQTHVTTTGSVSSSSTETDWFDPGTGLDLSQDTSQSGTYDGVAFSSQLNRKLLSARPS